MTAVRPEWRAQQQGTSPAFVVVSAWLLVAAFTAYSAPELRRQVLDDEWLRESELLVEGVTRLDRAVNGTELPRLRARLDEWAAAVRGPDPGLIIRPLPPARVPAAAEPTTVVASARGPGTPTAQAPRQRRLLLVGASSMEFYLGSELERRLESYSGVEVHRFGKLGTGLARPDLFNWPRAIAEMSEGFRPDVVIAQFGGNEAQLIESPDGGLHRFGSVGWEREYRRRVRALVDQVRRGGSMLVMLGVQVTRHPRISRQFDFINKLMKEEVERRGALFVPTWDLGVDADGAARVTIKENGETFPLFLRDGVHYSRPGATHIARRIAQRLELLLGLAPEDLALARVRRLEHHSAIRGRSVSALAWVPQLPPGSRERLPLLLLLHGASGSPLDFSEHAHQQLQALAARHRLVIVAPDGDPQSWYVNSNRVPGGRIASYLLDELLPFLGTKLPVSSQRGIAGISMGGNGALTLALKRPDLFASASALSGAVDLSEAHTRTALIDRLGPYLENKDRWESFSAMHLAAARGEVAARLPVLLTVGDADRWAGANRRLHQLLLTQGGGALLEVQSGGHEWGHWRSVLPRHLEWHARQLHTASRN